MLHGRNADARQVRNAAALRDLRRLPVNRRKNLSFLLPTKQRWHKEGRNACNHIQTPIGPARPHARIFR
jgi:hypothetical protein